MKRETARRTMSSATVAQAEIEAGPSADALSEQGSAALDRLGADEDARRAAREAYERGSVTSKGQMPPGSAYPLFSEERAIHLACDAGRAKEFWQVGSITLRL